MATNNDLTQDYVEGLLRQALTASTPPSKSRANLLDRMRELQRQQRAGMRISNPLASISEAARQQWLTSTKAVEPDLPTRLPSIGVAASTGYRQGPNSYLVRLFADFIHMFGNSSDANILAVGGAYRTLKSHLGASIEHHLKPLPDGRAGGLREMAELVMDRDHENSIDLVIYLTDPTDPTVLFPEAIELEDACLLAGVPFISNYVTAREWLILIQLATSRGPHFEGLVRGGRDLKTDQTSDSIAMIADDSGKTSLLMFAVDHFDLLTKFRRRSSTQTMTQLLRGELTGRFASLEAYNAATDETRRDLTFMQIESAVKGLVRSAGPVSLQSWVSPITERSGEVTKLGNEIATGQVDRVLVFDGAERTVRHDRHVSVLERGSQVADREIRFLRGAETCRQWADLFELASSRIEGTSSVQTISSALRDRWGVASFLSANDDWNSIVDAAGRYLGSLLEKELVERISQGSRYRIGVGVGASAAEVIAMTAKRLAKKGSKFSPPVNADSIEVIPLAGVYGVRAPWCEANGIAQWFAEGLGGSYRAFPWAAYGNDTGTYSEVLRDWDQMVKNEFERFEESWDTLDLSVATAGRVDGFNLSQVGMLASSFDDVLHSPVGHLAGMLLDVNGNEVEMAPYQRYGASRASIIGLARRGASVLVAGGQPDRLAPTVAALNGGLISVLISSTSFAAALLELAND